MSALRLYIGLFLSWQTGFGSSLVFRIAKVFVFFVAKVKIKEENELLPENIYVWLIHTEVMVLFVTFYTYKYAQKKPNQIRDKDKSADF